MSKVVLKRGRAKPLWHGHPWVYSQAVASAPEGDAEVVSVHDADGRFIGRGFYNPRSQIAVRIATRAEEELDAAFVRRRLEAAKALRARLGLPSAETSAYRLVNSEGDGLPGLIADVYGDAVSVSFTTLGMKKLEAAVFEALGELLSPATIYEVGSGGHASTEGIVSSPRVVRGESRREVTCRENGVEMTVEPLGGQKTGAFLDQREHRALIGSLARGARVLDLYTYLGGFSIAALRGGAESATAVDMSPKALARASQNAERAGVLAKLELVEADVFRWLEGAGKRDRDLVIVDPPKFASSKKDLDAALKGYRRLNALAFQTVRPGGLVASCSCSQLVDAAELERLLAAAAVDVGRELTVLKISGQPPDHPVPAGFSEGRYLKLILCRLG